MQNKNFPFQAVPQSHWPLTSSAHKCVVCGKTFGLFQTAENCRGCGRVCCSSCLSDHLVLPGQPGTAPVPVCQICADSITRTYEEAEMTMQRCQLLEEIVNEQALQAEKTRSDLREQQEENKLLRHEKEQLKATIARMEIEAEVAAAKVEATTRATAASTPPAVASPTASPVKPDSDTNALGDGALSEGSLAAMEEKLNKKKRQLDMREATLKDALKKVSADAAKNADQRAALQEQEKQLTALVTSKFTALFEEERQRLEDMSTDAVTDMQNQFVAWVGQQQDGVIERRRKYEQLMEERQHRTAAELVEMRTSRDALQRQLELQTREIEKLQAEARNAAAAHSMLVGAAAQQQQEQQQQQEDRTEQQELNQGAIAATRRAEKAEGEVHRLQAELDSTKALYTEETQAREIASAAYQSEQRQAQQRLEALTQGFRAQQEEAKADRDAAVAAARQAAAEHHAQELAAQQERLEAKAAADVEAAVQRERRQHAAAMERDNAQHGAEKEALENTVKELERRLQEAVMAEEQQPLDAPPKPTVEEAEQKEEAAAAALAHLQELHLHEAAAWAASQNQLEARLREAESQREDTLKDSAAAFARAAQEHAATVAELTAEHQREKAAWETKTTQLKRAQAQQEDGLQRQDKTWREEKAALLKTCNDLEARLETRKKAAWQLQQQLRDCKQQLSELQAQYQKKATEEETATVAQSRAATTLQRSAAALVKEVQQAQQRVLTEHTAAVTHIRSELQETAKAASAASSQKKTREAVKQLASQVASVKEEKEEVQQQLKAEQERRSNAEAKLEKLKASLYSMQSTEQQQRQTMAELQEKYHHVADELEAVKAAKATQAALSESPSPSPSRSLENETHLLGVQQHWVQQQAHVEGLYAMALTTVLQHEWSAAMDVVVEHLASEAWKQRQMRARNATALENTTSTIREVQEDLRVRAQALVQRQTEVEEQERRIAEKKKRVDAVCRDLYAVAKELRTKHLDGTDCAGVEQLVRSARVVGEDV
ncbi:hypothetical protein ABB37_08343 [Leptomonas pyrrhocoris]|uniref:FYVE-type domain-containing protein n=1 Tax=Leptomonas pyrrhocoris TaxID=157538 RepID=A0A0N0VDJ4_LEPPY|nr:hypothetical protein ABB37_08343 [Leptomonas pyrrhocoris]KPA75828.1 hypothetical protein ABB37_08343 [Leptomonas pyrrhocoris]|eukprot:XP_015654267.1 hypothetical protein ABB37_08343 [Leptomonas pyrrhocoris]